MRVLFIPRNESSVTYVVFRYLLQVCSLLFYPLKKVLQQKFLILTKSSLLSFLLWIMLLVLQLTFDPTLGLEVFLHLFFFFQALYFHILLPNLWSIFSNFGVVKHFLFEHNFRFTEELYTQHSFTQFLQMWTSYIAVVHILKLRN